MEIAYLDQNIWNDLHKYVNEFSQCNWLTKKIICPVSDITCVETAKMEDKQSRNLRYKILEHLSGNNYISTAIYIRDIEMVTYFTNEKIDTSSLRNKFISENYLVGREFYFRDNSLLSNKKLKVTEVIENTINKNFSQYVSQFDNKDLNLFFSDTSIVESKNQIQKMNYTIQLYKERLINQKYLMKIFADYCGNSIEMIKEKIKGMDIKSLPASYCYVWAIYLYYGNTNVENKKTSFNLNDLAILHYLPYVDIFVTKDGELFHLANIVSNKLKLNVKILNKTEDFVNYLRIVAKGL